MDVFEFIVGDCKEMELKHLFSMIFSKSDQQVEPERKTARHLCTTRDAR